MTMFAFYNNVWGQLYCFNATLLFFYITKKKKNIYCTDLWFYLTLHCEIVLNLWRDLFVKIGVFSRPSELIAVDQMIRRSDDLSNRLQTIGYELIRCNNRYWFDLLLISGFQSTQRATVRTSTTTTYTKINASMNFAICFCINYVAPLVYCWLAHSRHFRQS